MRSPGARRFLIGLVLFVFLCISRRNGGAQLAKYGNSNAQNVSIMAFDVSSVRPNIKNDGRWNMMFTADSYIATGVTAKQLIQDAFGIYGDARMFGLSGWTVNERYDLEAKVDPSEASVFAALSQSQKRLLLQDLLEKRFKLVSHHDVRMESGYVLVQSKKGAKMAEAGSTTTDQSSYTRMRHGQWTAAHSTAGQLATSLALELSQPVQDETHLSGNYTFSVDWDPKYGKIDGAGTTNSDSGISIFTAIQEQLGLNSRRRRSRWMCLSSILWNGRPRTESAGERAGGITAGDDLRCRR